MDNDSSGTITLNDGLLYQIEVTNAGNAPLFNILVRDITFGIPVTCPATSLTAGAGMLCTTNSPHTVTLIESNASKVMMNVYAAGDYGSASYTQTVGLTTPVTQNPSIQLLKSLVSFDDNDSSGTITQNDGLWFQFELTNTGNVTVSNLRVTDVSSSLPVACPPVSLAPGNVVTCNTTAAHLVSAAEVTAGEVRNTAIASVDFGPATYSNSDTLVIPLSIQLVKSLSTYDDNDVSSTITLGDALWYQFEITNIGSLTLNNISVADNTFGVLITCPTTTLAPGASMTCAAGTTHTVSLAEANAGNVHNFATVTGRPPSGLVVMDTDSIDTSVIGNAGLSISKSASLLTYDTAGQVIDYTFVVTNTGNVTVSGPITIDDDKAADESCPAGNLDPGNPITCTATYTVTQADLDSGSVTNTALATGASPGGSPVASAPDTVTVIAAQNPGIQIVKMMASYGDSDGSSSITLGDELWYRFNVNNTGNVTLDPVTVTDNSFGIPVTCPQSTLAPGTSMLCLADAPHTVTVLEANAGQVSNTATVTGELNGAPYTASDTITTAVSQVPGILLVKSLQSYADNDSSGSITLGDGLLYQFMVTNTGNVSLSNLSVSDDTFGIPLDCPVTTLEPANSTICIALAAHTVTLIEADTGQISNSATASAEFNAVSYTSTDISITSIQQNPAIALTKGGNPLTYSSPGQVITYTYTIQNTGNITLTGPFSITDDKTGMIDPCGSGSLIPGATTSCTTTYAVTQYDLDFGSLTNSATAHTYFSGTPVASSPDSVTATALQSPSYTIAKSVTDVGGDGPGGHANQAGDVISYQITLVNTGNVSLIGASASDPLLGTLTGPTESGAADGILGVGETWTYVGAYTVTQADLENNGAGDGDIDNTASATTTFLPTPQTAIASVPVDQSPALTLTKSADLATYDVVGQTITYTYTIENSGNQTLAGPFTVDDDVQGALTDCAAGPLAPLATDTCTSTHTVTQADIDAGSLTNTATVSGNGVTSPADSVTVSAVQSPALALTKTADLSSYNSVGQVITYTYAIKNDGNVTLAGPFTVDDDKQGVLADCATGPLAPSGTTTCTSTHSVTQADIDAGSLTNTATVSGNSVTSTADSLTINAIQNPTIQVVKSSATTEITTAGQVVSYNLTASNIGNLTLTSITVDDANCTTAPVYQSGDTNTDNKLDPSESWIYSCSHTVTQAEMDNGGNLSNMVTADSSESVAVTDSLTIPITQAPAIQVLKSSSTASITSVSLVLSYNFAVSNTGNVSLTGISVSDPNCDAAPTYQSGDTDSDSQLDLSENWTYSCSHTVTQSEMDAGGNLSNTVAADSVESAPDSDVLDIPIVQSPALALTKSADLATYDTVGQVITYTYSIQNSGNITLPGPFTVDDDKQGTLTDCAAGPLAPVDTITCTATHIVTQADLDAGSIANSAAASGNSVTSAPDSLTVTAIQNPELTLSKTADRANYATAGQVITYRFDVTNTGNVTITSPITVDDNLTTNETCPVGDLAPGASISCSATYLVAQNDLDTGSIINSASASGTDPNSNLVASATDTYSIPAIQTPSIQIVKSLASYTDNDTTWNITRNDALWYQFELTNIGNVTLTNVSVSDETFVIPVTCLATTLAPSEEVVCTADSSHVITPAEADAGQVSNTVLAQGEFNSAIYTAYDTLVTIVNPVSLSVISGQVRDDSNGNGNLGDNDAGLANIQIELDDGTCTLGVDCRSATTDTNGVFTFNTVADGSYILVENDLAAYLSTADSDPPNDNQIDMILLGGLSSTNNVFLDTANPAFCSAPHPSNGFVVSTNPSNGTTNVPLSTATITVTFNQPMITAGAESVLLAGKYELKNTSNGKIVTVSVVTYDPVTYTATLTIDTSDPDWQAGTLYNLTIKNLKNACGTAQTNVVRAFTTELEISGQVLNNLDSKGIYGVRVELTGGSCGGSCGVTRTGLNGQFRFTGFAPSNYTLTETELPGFNSVNDSNPPNDNLINLTLAAGSNSTGHTFIDTPAVCSAPGVAGTNPTNGATGIPLSTSTLTVTFNQPMVTYGAGSVVALGNFDNNIDNLSLGGDVPILDISYNPDTHTATLTINTSDPQWQAGSQFRLRIKGSLKNPCGTNLGSDVDVLFTTGAFITGQVRNSLDGKGVYGAPVELTGASCGGSCGSTMTDLNGDYNFSGVTPGSYTLLQTNLPGYTSLSDSNPPNDDQIALTLAAGSNSTGHLFTDTPSCIGGANFVASSNPANNATSISLSITTVTVTFNQPMVTYGGGSVLELGNFDNNLDNLTLGGDVPILDIAYDPNTYTATLAIDTSDPQWRPGSQFRLRIKDSIKNACDGRPASNTDILFTTDLVISGQVREDLDGDGDLSDLDPGISGVMVELYDGACILLLTCQTTVTNSGGFFTFDNLEPGNYTLYEIDPLGYVSTADSDGGNSNQIAVNLVAGTNSIGNRFLDKRWP